MNRKKHIILIISFFLSILIVYHLNIKKTFNSRKKYKELCFKKASARNYFKKIHYLKQKEKHLNNSLKENDISIYNSFQQMLLKKISDFSSINNINIKSFKQPYLNIENKITKETYVFSVQGDFINTIKLMNYLENEQLGKLTSINFKKEKNYKTKKEYLCTTVYLQKAKN